MVKKLNRLVFGSAFLILVLVAIMYVWNFLPVVSGYAAKVMCSGIFLCDRTEGDLRKDELGLFPFSLAKLHVNRKDQSVTCSVWGFAVRKAIYRPALGATLINGVSEQELRNRKILLAQPSPDIQDFSDWPAEDSASQSASISVEPHQLAKAIDMAFGNIKEKDRRTRAVLVAYEDKIVAERYSEGFSKESKQAGWSMTKGVLNAMIGILVMKGKWQVGHRAPVTGWQDDQRKFITIEELMQMSSGLRWNEFSLTSSDAATMLFKEKDMGAYAARSDLVNVPGKVFNYSDGPANILSAMIRNTLGDSSYYRFPYECLFYKLGMFHTTLETDAAGNFVGSSYCYATARDWARLGMLYLHDGIWKKEQILPPGWVRFSSTPSPAGKGRYGALFWLNKQDSSKPFSTRPYPHVPADCFSFQGYQGQYIWIIPSRNLVVVRLAMETGDLLDPDLFLQELLKAFPA